MLDTGEIARLRLYHQHIGRKALERPADVVSRLCAVQAQDYFGAKWAVGLRLRDARDEDVEDAFDRGDILRTHMLRPTWHFTTPADIRWLLSLTGPRVVAGFAPQLRKTGLTPALLRRSDAAIAKALRGGSTLTREEMRAALEKQGVACQGVQRLAYLMMHAELEAIVCSGPRRGKQFTYALLDDRVPAAKAVAPETALARLAERYFSTRGPATVQDFSKWSGLGLAYARQGLEAVRAKLRHESVEGISYWMPPASPAPDEASPRAHLLSAFDEYITSYKDRAAHGETRIVSKLFTLGNALTYVMVLDGNIVGWWNRTLEKKSVAIRTKPLIALGRREKQAIAAAAGEYGNFLELPVTLDGKKI